MRGEPYTKELNEKGNILVGMTKRRRVRECIYKNLETQAPKAISLESKTPNKFSTCLNTTCYKMQLKYSGHPSTKLVLNKQLI